MVICDEIMKRKIAGWRNEICRSEILFKKNQGYNGNNLNVPKSLKAAAQKLCREYNQTMPDEGENAFIAPGVCIACAGHSIDSRENTGKLIKTY